MTKNATLVALVVFALAAAATAAFVDDGMLYVVGKTERKSQLQFYGFEIPGGFPVHNFDWFVALPFFFPFFCSETWHQFRGCLSGAGRDSFAGPVAWP